MMKSRQCVFYIGDAARRTGVPVETIRYYEREGILQPPERGRNGYRLYNRAHLERLMFVKRCRALGFSLQETQSLLSLADSKTRTCRQISAIAKAKLRDVRAKIADLKRMETVLEDYVEICPGDATADCPIVAALSHRPDGNGRHAAL